MTTVAICALVLGTCVGFCIGVEHERADSIVARLALLDDIYRDETPADRAARAAREDAEEMEREAGALLRSVGYPRGIA